MNRGKNKFGVIRWKVCAWQCHSGKLPCVHCRHFYSDG